jgi:hypothetical protein
VSLAVLRYLKNAGLRCNTHREIDVLDSKQLGNSQIARGWVRG